MSESIPLLMFPDKLEAFVRATLLATGLVEEDARITAEALTLADRIILLSARPGRLKEDFRIDFPRPRDAVQLRETRQYAELFQKIWHSLGEEFTRSRST